MPNSDTTYGVFNKQTKEIKYHLKHSKSWVVRLGDGTKESKKKIKIPS